MHITKTPTHYKNPHTHTHTHTLQPHTYTHTHTHTHILQSNIKPTQYKLKQTQHKIDPNEIVTHMKWI